MKVVIPSAGSPRQSIVKKIIQNNHLFTIGDVVRFNGTSYVKAQADNAVNAEVIGIVSKVIDLNIFEITQSGFIKGLSGLSPGFIYFLSTINPGLLTTQDALNQGEISKPLFVSSSSSEGYFVNQRGMILTEPSGGSGQTLVEIIQQNNHGFNGLEIVRLDSSIYVPAQADSAVNAEVIGIISNIIDSDSFELTGSGSIEGFSNLIVGSVYFLSTTIPGQFTNQDAQNVGEISKPVLIATSSTSAYFLNQRGLIITDPLNGSSVFTYEEKLALQLKMSFDTAKLENYTEFTYDSGTLTNIDIYENDTKLDKIFSKVLTYSTGTLIKTELTRINDGVKLVKDLNYDSGELQNIYCSVE